jgi:hypothetical protein
MKKGSKTERSLICLVPRKHTFRVLPETSPHPSDCDGSILKSLDSNRQMMGHAAMLSTLKKNLSTVKQDV